MSYIGVAIGIINVAVGIPMYNAGDVFTGVTMMCTGVVLTLVSLISQK